MQFHKDTCEPHAYFAQRREMWATIHKSENGGWLWTAGGKGYNGLSQGSARLLRDAKQMAADAMRAIKARENPDAPF